MRRALLMLLVGVAVVGCDDEDPEVPVEPPPRPATSSAAAQGRGLYRRYCALCHGRNGEGYEADDAPSLVSPEWQRSATDDFIRRAIIDGRPGTAMSAWSVRSGGPLEDVQIDRIVLYLRSWRRGSMTQVDDVQVEGDPQRGRLVYVAKCMGCHGPSGEGAGAVAISNPALLATASDGFLQYAVAHGRSGTRMRAFRDELTPVQIDDVVAFVRQYQSPTQGIALPEGPAAPPELPDLAEMQLVIHPDGSAPSFELRSERFVAAAAVRAAFDSGQRMIILDARATSDWLRQRIPGAIPVPFYEMDQLVTALPRDGTWMIAYCACPHAASGHVVDALRRGGFTNTAVLDEGIEHWESEGYPVTSGSL